MEVTVLQGKIQEIEVELAKFEREIDLLKTKEQELYQHLRKSTSICRNNKVQPLEKQKSLEILGKLMEDEKVCFNQSQRNESATPSV